MKKEFLFKNAVKLQLSYLREVRNYEFFVFFKEFVKLMGNVNIDFAVVEGLLARVLRHGERLEELNKQPMAHRLSEAINLTSDSLRHVLRALRATAEASAESSFADEREHGRVLAFWLKKVRSNMASTAKVRQAKAVMAMQKGYDMDPKIAVALEALGLTVIYDRAVELHAELEAMKQIRLADWAKLKAMRDGLRRDIVRDLKLLMRSLAGLANMEGAHRSYYEELCGSINGLLSNARAIHLARMTRYENERLAAMEDGGDGEPELDSYDEFEQWDQGQLGV